MGRSEVNFYRINIPKSTQFYLEKLINNSDLLISRHFSKECENWFQQKLGLSNFTLTPSCSQGLDLVVKILFENRSGEVILPSFTHPATANAIILNGLTPVYVDIDSNTLNIDPKKVKEALTERTVGVIAVNYGGVSCDLVSIRKLCDRYNLKLIEDNAHGILAKFNNDFLGSFGDAAVFSFERQKNITCGEGGGIVLKSQENIDYLKSYADSGTNRAAFMSRNLAYYQWMMPGSKFKIGEFTAAFLFAQLMEAEEQLNHRKKIWEFYKNALQNYEDRFYIPNLNAAQNTNGHIFYLIDRKQRNGILLEHFKSNNIEALFHYYPLHKSEFGGQFNLDRKDLPVTEMAGNHLIRLPIHNEMRIEEAERVVEVIENFIHLND